MTLMEYGLQLKKFDFRTFPVFHHFLSETMCFLLISKQSLSFPLSKINYYDDLPFERLSAINLDSTQSMTRIDKVTSDDLKAWICYWSPPSGQALDPNTTEAPKVRRRKNTSTEVRTSVLTCLCLKQTSPRQSFSTVWEMIHSR